MALRSLSSRISELGVAFGTVLLLVPAGCNTRNDEPVIPPTPPLKHVYMVNFAFQPESLRIGVGDTVIWVNQSSTYHTTTSGRDGVPDSVWDSGFMAGGDSFRWVFPTVGSYHYYCTPHWRAGMQGRIFVTARPVRSYVRMRDYAFVPESLKLRAGDTVVWVNDGAEVHTSTSGANGTPDGRWDSGQMAHGDSFVHAFPDAGAYPYFCSFHYPMGMVGWVLVAAASRD